MVPGSPETRTTCPSGIPPRMMSSSPSTYVRIRSRAIVSYPGKDDFDFLRGPFDAEEHETHVRIGADDRHEERPLAGSRADHLALLRLDDGLEESALLELSRGDLARPHEGRAHRGHLLGIGSDREEVGDDESIPPRDRDRGERGESAGALHRGGEVAFDAYQGTVSVASGNHR